jgi:hypothetical protein
VKRARKSFAIELRRLFKKELRRSLGGWVTRIDAQPVEQGIGVFRTVLYVKSYHANGVEAEEDLHPLWSFVADILGVPLGEITISPAEDYEREWFNHFTVLRHAEEPENWSDYGVGDIADDESVISIHEITDYLHLPPNA